MDYYPFYQTDEAQKLNIKVRLSIFIITGVCAGLPALAWSVSGLIHHRKNGHRISVFILLLLLTDVAELFLSPYILIRLFLDEISCSMDWTCLVLGGLWWSSKDCGFLLNQLVALEGILAVKYPLYTTTVFSSSFYRIFYMYAFLSIIVSHVFFHKYYYVIIVSMFIVSLIPCIISCRASRYADRDTNTSRKSDHHILIVFMFSLLIYLPFVLLNSLSIFISPMSLFPPVSLIPVFLLSLRLISDPLLCVLVCRQNLSVQTSQKPEGLL